MNRATRSITDRGVAVFGGALAMLAIGMILGDGVLVTLGSCGLLLVGAAFVLAPLNLRGLEVRLQLPRRFIASRSVPLTAELRNPRPVLDAFQVEVVLRFPHRTERRGYSGRTAAESVSVLHDRLSIPSRAEAIEASCEFRSRFPFGIFEVCRLSAVPCPILVYPRLVTPVELLAEGSQPDIIPTAGTALGDFFGEPRGIRPYQPGDPANRIHQPATARAFARGQGLQVQAYDPPGFHPNSCRIVFHSYATAGKFIRFDRFERALSLVAGTLVHLQSLQTKITFQADFTRWRCRACENRSQLHACLALLARTKRARRTQAGELSEILQMAPADEQLIVISDSPPEHWADLVPNTHQQVIVVNIRQIRFKRRRMQVVR